MQNGESKEIVLPKTTPLEDIVLDVDQLPAPILSVIGDYIENPEILQLGNQFFRPQKPMKSPFYQMTARKYKDLTADFQEWWDLIGTELTAMSQHRKETKEETKSGEKVVPKSSRELFEELFKESNYILPTHFFAFCVKLQNTIEELLTKPENPKLNAMVAVYCHFRPKNACYIFEHRLLRVNLQENIRDCILFLKHHVALPVLRPEGIRYFAMFVDVVHKDEKVREVLFKNRHLQPCLLENISVAIQFEEKVFWELFENLGTQEQLGLTPALVNWTSSFLTTFQENFRKKTNIEQCSFLCKAIDMASKRFDWLLLFLKGHAALPTAPKKAKYLGAEQSPEEKHFNELLQIACSPIHPHPALRATPFWLRNPASPKSPAHPSLDGRSLEQNSVLLFSSSPRGAGEGNLNSLVLEALFGNSHFPKFFNECLRLANDSLGQAADSLSLSLDGIENVYVKFVIAVLKINKRPIPLKEHFARERFMQLVNSSSEVRTALEKRKENRDLLLAYLSGYLENPPFIEMIILLLNLRTTLPEYETHFYEGFKLIRAANIDQRVVKILLKREEGKRWLIAFMKKAFSLHTDTSLQHHAAECGNLEVLMQLVEHLPSIDLNMQAEDLFTPLMCAVYGFIKLIQKNDPRAENCFKVINYLLDQGSDLNALTKDGFSVLGLTAVALNNGQKAVIRLFKLFLEKGAIWNGVIPSKNARIKLPRVQTPYVVSSEQETQGFVFFMNHPVGQILRSHVSDEECKAIFSKITRKEEKALVDSKQENTVAALQEAIEKADAYEFRRILNTPEGEIFALHALFELKSKGLEGQRLPLLHSLINLLERENTSFKLIVILKNEFPKLFAVLLTSRMEGNKTPLYYLLEWGVCLRSQWILNTLKLLLSGDGKRMINVYDTEKYLTPWLLCAKLPCGAKCVQYFIEQGLEFVFSNNFYPVLKDHMQVMDYLKMTSKVIKQQLQDYCQVIFKHLKAIMPAKEFLEIRPSFLAISTSWSLYELTQLCLDDINAQEHPSLLDKTIGDATPLAKAIRRTLEPYVLQPNNDLLQEQIYSFKTIGLLLTKGANLNAPKSFYGPIASDFWCERFRIHYSGLMSDWKTAHQKNYQTTYPGGPSVPILEVLKAPELQPPAGYTWEKVVTEATDELIFYHLARLQVHYDKLSDEQRQSFDKLCKERFANYQEHTKQRVDVVVLPLPLVEEGARRAGKGVRSCTQQSTTQNPQNKLTI